IAVLNQGKVCQVGTPQEIYRDPTDLFVATFIGSPPMNLIEDGESFLGFRPEAFLPKEVEPVGDNVRFPFRITRIEYRGAVRVFYEVTEGRTPKPRVISKMPTNIRPHGAPDHVYAFVVRRQDLEPSDRASCKRLNGANA